MGGKAQKPILWAPQTSTVHLQMLSPNIPRPVRDQQFQAAAVVPVESPRRLLVPCQIARHRRHEPLRRIQRRPRASLLLASGLIHQPAQRRRSAVRLLLQPLPVTRQQRDFPADHAQPRPTRSGTRWERSNPRQHLIEASPQVEIHLPAGAVFKHEDCGGLTLVETPLQDAKHLFDRAGSNPELIGKCGVCLIFAHEVNLPG